MIDKLKRKFVIVNMTIVTVMLFVIFSLVIYFTRTNMEERSQRIMNAISFLADEPGSPAYNGQTAPGVPAPAVFCIRKLDGKYIGAGSPAVDLADEELMQSLYEKVMQQRKQTGTLENYSLRFQVRHHPGGEYVVFADITEEEMMLKRLVQNCLLIALLSFGLFLVISIFLAGWIAKPVEQAWNQQKQFVADASHELKTPLTIIMTNAEMLADGKNGDKKQKQSADSILIMAKQMRGLTESLLELARNDRQQNTHAFEMFNMSELVISALLPFEPLYFEKEKELKSEIEDNIYLRGDAQALCRVIEILLDNAMKYSSEYSQVIVRLEKHKGAVLLSVASKGDCISKEDLHNIFKRFYRMDKARSMNQSYGLGLSIAESIVQEHDGRIWAESEDGNNTFYVKFAVKNQVHVQAV